jgi:hypothetical protein
MVVKDPNPMRNQMTPPVVLNRTTVVAKKPEPQLAQATKPNALAVGTAPVQANQKRNRKSYATLVASRSGERTVTPAATQSSAPVVKQPVKPTTKPESDPVVLPASNDEPIVIIGALPDAPGRATETEAVTGVLVGG